MRGTFCHSRTLISAELIAWAICGVGAEEEHKIIFCLQRKKGIETKGGILRTIVECGFKLVAVPNGYFRH